MSTAPARRPGPPRPPPDHPGGPARHRKRSPAGPSWWGRLGRAAAVAAAGVGVLFCGWAVALHGRAHAPAPTGGWLSQAANEIAIWSGGWASKPKIVSATVASGPGDSYRNPLRLVSGLVAQRIDDGADFAGAGPVYALGDGVVTAATGSNSGWPGGGWITYRLTSGPARGLVVFVAEDVTPAVVTGQRVSPTTVIGTMYNGPDGIETGWAQQSSVSAEAELPEAGGIGGLGPFPTKVGVNFDELLTTLGVPAAPNLADPSYGLLPAGYPPSWG